MKSLNILKVMLIATIVVLFTACGGFQSESPQKMESNVITDRGGNEINVPENVERIISMAPSITETLVHLGLGDKLIAVDKFSADIDGTPENLPAYDILSPDTESIAALEPDIIFASGMSRANGEDPFKPVTDLGALMTYIPVSESIDAIKEDILFIGRITGAEEQAENIVKDMEKRINDILSKTVDAESGKTVYFEVAAAPDIYSFGRGAFLNEMIELLGASNILDDQEGWVGISEETVIEKNPDVIFTLVDYIDDPVSDILNRNGWDVVSAVQNEQVYRLDANASSRPNEYITVAFAQMAEALYPDSFK